ncbi:MAG TPA: hypothetical protein PLR99_18955 [Polyangiaceae bacterium]|nr:hypothetical protein [Polyangiaceae bacterium]
MKKLSLRATVRGRLWVTGAMVGLLGAAFGCQLIVPTDPPAYACQEGVAGACPTGQFCSGGTCVVGSPKDTSPPPPPPEDAEVPDTLPPIIDAGPDRADVAVGPAPLGGACRLDKECAAGLLCGTEGLLGQAAQASGPVCTKICCTSEQCGAGFVCLSPGSGGSYCVAATALAPDRNLPSSGGAKGGTPCGTNTECRSGLCADLGGSGGKRCIDSCCLDSDCAGGTCNVRTLSSKYTGFVCANPPSTVAKDAGGACTVNSNCRSNYCIGETACGVRCCASAQCGAGNSCIWNFAGPNGTDIVQHCLPTGTRAAAKSPCTNGNDCASTQCELESNGQPDGSTTSRVCRDVCCLDSDCPSSERCLPAPDNPRVLRCVPK